MSTILTHVPIEANEHRQKSFTPHMIDFMSGSEHDRTVPAGPGYQTFPPLALQAGQHVGEFQLIREIGRGGFGEVWVVNQSTRNGNWR